MSEEQIPFWKVPVGDVCGIEVNTGYDMQVIAHRKHSSIEATAVSIKGGYNPYFHDFVNPKEVVTYSPPLLGRQVS